MRIVTGLMLTLVLVLGSMGASGQASEHALGREHDPVVVTGQAMPEFLNAPLDELFVYAYTGTTWQQIPWQFDEVKDGEYVTTDDGMLSSKDELVFMAADSGVRAASDAWISDPDAAIHPRYELKVTDPLQPADQGWVYVYRSSTLVRTNPTRYATFDQAQSTLTTDRYVLGILRDYLGLDRLELNGSGVDILDRTKVRMSLQFIGIQTEEAFAIDPPAVTSEGPVRVIIGDGDVIAYRSQFQSIMDVDLDELGIPVAVLWGRFSMDLSPAATGSRYYDANTPAGVLVDGVADNVATTPAVTWHQVSGPTGTLVRVIDYSEAGGTPSTYYLDDKSNDPDDTGDHLAYGDSGVTIANPARVFVLHNWTYILPPDQPNVGATYHAYARSPLSVEAFAQYAPGIATQTPTATPTATVTLPPTATSTATPSATAPPAPTVTPTETPASTINAVEQYLPLLVRRIELLSGHGAYSRRGRAANSDTP